MNNNDFIQKLYLIISDKKGNQPFVINSILPEYEITQANIEYLNKLITQGSFFLKKIEDGQYIKTYRIEEACLRTIKELKNEGFTGVSLKMIEDNPNLLHDELKRWFDTRHDSMLSYVVDKYWHNFVLYAKEYEDWCYENYKCFFYHTPRFPYENNMMTDEEILFDIIKFFKIYSVQYKLDDRILLYNFPLLLSKNNIDMATIKKIIDELISE